MRHGTYAGTRVRAVTPMAYIDSGDVSRLEIMKKKEILIRKKREGKCGIPGNRVAKTLKRWKKN